MDNKWLETLQAALDEAEMILVGLGEEWEEKRLFKDDAAFQAGRQYLDENDLTWLIPAWNDYCLTRVDSKAAEALDNLRRFLGEKNYFVISTSFGKRVCSTSSIPTYKDTLVEIMTRTIVLKIQILASPTAFCFIRYIIPEILVKFFSL